MTEILALKHLTPIAAGKQRYVFRHPINPGLIVKVPHEDYARRKAGIGGRWYKPVRRYRHFLVFLRELREHLALRAVNPQIPRFIQTIVGFVETDLGLGLVTRAIHGHDGDLAPNLRTLLLEGRFTEAMRGELQVFFDWLVASPVILGDLHIGNLVYAYEPGYGGYFAVVDGIGEKNVIPLNSLSPRLNRRSKERKIRRVKRQIETLRSQARKAATGG
jgi:hypothetical protein